MRIRVKLPKVSRGGGVTLSVLRRLVRPRESQTQRVVAASGPNPTGEAINEAFPSGIHIPHTTMEPALSVSSPTSGGGAVAEPQLGAPPRATPIDDDESDSDAGSSTEEDIGDPTVDKQTMKKAKKKNKSKTSRTKWVAKLLNQVGVAPKDRIHRKKRKVQVPEPRAGCHDMLRLAHEPYAALWGRVFDCLAPLEPSRACATVSKALAFYTQVYFTRHRAWPRPVQYLRHRVLTKPEDVSSGILSRILEWLPVHDRVRVAGTSHLFQRVADALPLTLYQADPCERLLSLMPPDRILRRFHQTQSLEADAISSSDAVRLLQIFADIDDDQEISIKSVALRHLAGFERESQFVQLAQTLFTDRISLQLHTLVLCDLQLRDTDFRHLARLFYDGRFPALRSLDVSKNRFSSRFMRDWAKCFREARFRRLESLDISDVGMGQEDMERFFACLHHTPELVTLNISHNLCLLPSLRVFASVVSERKLPKLAELHCSAISAQDHTLHVLVLALAASTRLRHLDLSGNDWKSGCMTLRALTDAITAQNWPALTHLSLSFNTPTVAGHDLLARAITTKTTLSLTELHVAGNGLEGTVFEAFVRGLETRSLRHVRTLNLADNRLGPLEFDLLAQCLSDDACPLLGTLMLSGNRPQAEGVQRFLPFLSSMAARKLHTLDLSRNSIPSRSLVFVAEELMRCQCLQLQVLDVSRNLLPVSVTSFQKLVRSDKCPSLACVQIGYAQSREDGYAFVRHVRQSIGVEELRRRKQAKFEQRMRDIEAENVAKAARATARCKRQTRHLRELYDHMESVADRALRRRKKVRKSKHLLIHEEIERLKQEQYRQRISDELQRALAVV